MPIQGDRLCATMTSQTVNHYTTHPETQTHGATINASADIAGIRSHHFLRIRLFVMMNVGMITTTVDRGRPTCAPYRMQSTYRLEENDTSSICWARDTANGYTTAPSKRYGNTSGWNCSRPYRPAHRRITRNDTTRTKHKTVSLYGFHG